MRVNACVLLTFKIPNSHDFCVQFDQRHPICYDIAIVWSISMSVFVLVGL